MVPDIVDGKGRCCRRPCADCPSKYQFRRDSQLGTLKTLGACSSSSLLRSNMMIPKARNAPCVLLPLCNTPPVILLEPPLKPKWLRR